LKDQSVPEPELPPQLYPASALSTMPLAARPGRRAGGDDPESQETCRCVVVPRPGGVYRAHAS